VRINVPSIFGVNYFQKDKNGKYLTGMHDKRVWLSWMERRVHGEVEVLKTPIGYIPHYADIKKLFKEILDKEYTSEQYDDQFMLRIPENIAKIDRMRELYDFNCTDVPDILFTVLDEQKKRLMDLKASKGDYVKPNEFLN